MNWILENFYEEIVQEEYFKDFVDFVKEGSDRSSGFCASSGFSICFIHDETINLYGNLLK